MHEPHCNAKLPFPVRMQPFAVATFISQRDEMHRTFGPPHFLETDPTRTCGGIEEMWAWETTGGQRIMLKLAVPVSSVLVYADPPDSTPALAAIGVGLTPANRLEVYPSPIFDSPGPIR